ncbi:MAG: cytochrome C oxidase subunit IV family protein [Anaerolineales bacterium]|nr:cytochrome C oxidase subunit IV family protein [Anaerolineales bacterium]
MPEHERSTQMRTGWWVFIGLAALTGLEYWLSVALQGTLPYLTVTGVLKAALIVIYFMHVSQIWNPEGKRE